MESVHKAGAEVLAGITPDVREGGWCKYCPARQSCPAKMGLLAAFVSKGPAVLADDDMSTIYNKVRDLEKFSDKAMIRLKERAREAPIQLGVGHWYGYRNGRCVEYREAVE
jgi:hypothetical protein